MNDVTTSSPPFVEGVFHDMAAAEYFAIEALSQSGAKKIRRSPLHYLFDRTHRTAPTAAMQFGTVVHSGVLEPQELARCYAVTPSVDKRTNAGEAEWASFLATNAGRIFLSAADEVRALACIAAVRAHPAAARLLDGAVVEESLFWIDGRYGVPCKARLDARKPRPDGFLLVDVKTTADASAPEFARSIANFEYHAQGAHYISGAEHVLNESPRAFVFIAVESEPPHAVACYDLPTNGILAGQRLMAIALERYAEAMASGNWNAYPDTIESIKLPRWATSFDE